jgi:hypothetical protein
MQNKDEEKARREREIFTEFTPVTQLSIDAGSIQSERPPKPDISYSR